jgi:hypothetical protein
LDLGRCRKFSIEGFEGNLQGKIATTSREGWTTLKETGLIERKNPKKLKFEIFKTNGETFWTSEGNLKCSGEGERIKLW